MTSTVADEALDAPVEPRRQRGKGKKDKNWRHEGHLSVIALDLDLSADAAMRIRWEKQWSAAYRLERAVKRTARDRCIAYERHVGPRQELGAKKVRERLGVSRDGLTKAAYKHLEDSVWLRDHVTKAQALHTAAYVWESVNRYLFTDAAGRRMGKPKVSSWWDFTRMVGRARSHTKQATWETFRMVGSLQGHLNAYGDGVTVEQAAAAPAGTTVFSQPGAITIQRPGRGVSWWFYSGPLQVVFTGLKGGDLIAPVRLPQGAGSFARLAHFLADPKLWHKIDLVRIQDPKAPGGWRYQAHLTVLKSGYTSPDSQARRDATPTGRMAGIDANVGLLAAVSMPSSTLKTLDENSLNVTIVTPTDAHERAAVKSATDAKRRSAHLDRSRRASNPDQYHASKKQKARAERRAQAGLKPRRIDVPKGARLANKAGVPKRAYRKDALSQSYRQTRASHAAASSASAQRKNHAAELVVRDLIAQHGARWITEDVNINNWAKLWGKRLSVTTPGRIMEELRREAVTCGGQVVRASTFTTALSQHCICGARAKKTLGERWHSCPDCGLEADRDVLAAALAAVTILSDVSDPSTAKVDPTLLGVLARRVAAQQEEQVRSTIAYHGVSSRGSAGGSAARKRGASAEREDSAGHPRHRRPSRYEMARRRRSDRDTPGTPVPDF